MTKSLTAFAFAAIAASLSACGGGGGGNGFTDGGNQSDVGAQQVINANAAFAELNDGFDAVGAQSTAQDVVPTTGSAVFAGNLGLDMIGAVDPSNTTVVDASIVGDMTMTTNFVDRSVTGSVTNITYADTSGNLDNAGVGNLTIDGQAADNRGITRQTLQGAQRDLVTASLSGSLSVDQGGASDANLQIEAVLAGQFGSANGTAATGNPEVVRGFILGGPTTANPNAVTIPNGRFVGENTVNGTGILP